MLVMVLVLVVMAATGGKAADRKRGDGSHRACQRLLARGNQYVEVCQPPFGEAAQSALKRGR